MKQVAKVLVIDPQDQYLVLTLNNHPTFFNDSDLPGGTVDEGETPKDAAIREVQEEAGIELDPAKVTELYSGLEYSKHSTEYFLYETRLDARPEVMLSWEHESYEWVNKETLLKRMAEARDTYMHMVCIVLTSRASLSK